LLARAGELAAGGDVVLIGHGHSLRVAAARWAGFAPSAGAALFLGTATVSRLGHEHSNQVIREWNAPVTA